MTITSREVVTIQSPIPPAIPIYRLLPNQHSAAGCIDLTELTSTIADLLTHLVGQAQRALLCLSRPYRLLVQTPWKSASRTIIARTESKHFTSNFESWRKTNFSFTHRAGVLVASDLRCVGHRTSQALSSQKYIRSVYLTSTWIWPVLALIFRNQARFMYWHWRGRQEDYDCCPDNLDAVLIRHCAGRFVEEIAIQLSRLEQKDIGLSTTHASSIKEEQRQRQWYEAAGRETSHRSTLMKSVDVVRRHKIDPNRRPTFPCFNPNYVHRARIPPQERASPVAIRATA